MEQTILGSLGRYLSQSIILMMSAIRDHKNSIVSFLFFLSQYFLQCCGSMKFWNWYGSAYPYLWLKDPDPDPAIFRQWPSRSRLLFTFWRYIYIIFQRQKVIQKSQNSENQWFSYYCCLMIKKSGSGTGSLSLTNGSEPGSVSGRLKNIWILWIRICNTVFLPGFCWPFLSPFCWLFGEQF